MIEIKAAKPAARAFFILSGILLALGTVLVPSLPAQAADIPALHTYYQPTTDNQTKVFAGTFAAQTFTTDNVTSHTVTSIRLKLYRAGSPGTVTAAIWKTTAGAPSGAAIGSGTLDGNQFDVAANIYEFTLTNELSLEFGTTYAIVLSATSGDSVTNYIYWSNKTAGGYALGYGTTSTNYGVTWSTAGFANDFYFELWGNQQMAIQDVKVFQSFRQADDWLITVRYVNTVAPYYDTYDIKKYFVIQLVDNVTVVAQNVLPAWGNKVANIYIAAAQTVGMDWAKSTFKVRIYGTFTNNPYVEYTLLPADWAGVDMTQLDSWVLSSASVLSTYYSTTMTTYIADRGEVLNTTGGAIFSSGINGLSTVRPAIFQINTQSSTYAPNVTQQTYRIALQDWQTNWGADGTLMLQRLGGIIGMTGDFIASIGFVMLMAALALFAFPAGHSTAANILCVPALAIGVFFGVDLIFLGILGIFAAFLLIKNLWLDK